MSRREVGAVAKLSWFDPGDRVRFPDGREGTVVTRYPEDRVSGSTKVQWRDGTYMSEYLWDEENPLVTFLGSIYRP